MATSLAHAHRVPHTVKPPARCPHCGSTRLIRKGTRRKKLEIVQLWQCKLCRRVFTPAPAALRYKTYPLRIILDGVTLYNLGYSLPEAAAKLKSRHGYKVSPSTLASWMTEHRELVIPKTPYIVPYRVRHSKIEIARVYHSSRCWPDRL
jgi:transposase-like protein